MSQSQFVGALLAGQHAVALKILDAAISQPGDSSGRQQELYCLFINRGVCNARLQLYRKALKDYDAALSIQPSGVEALYQKGVVLQALKRGQEAEACWHSALSCATASTNISLIQAVQDALSNPSAVVANAAAAHSTVSNGFAPGQAPAQAAGTVPVAAAVQPAASTAAGAAPVPTPASQLQPQPASQPATPAPSDSRSSSSSGKRVSSLAEHAQGAAAAAGGGASASASRGGGASSLSQQQQAGTGGVAPDSGDAVEELDCAAQQRASRSGFQPGFLQPAEGPGRRAGSGAGSRPQAAPGSASSAAGVAAAAAGAGTPASVTLQGNQLSAAVAIQTAVAQINAGQVAEAESLLDGVLAANPKELGALVARGTARALRRDLRGAVEDFSGAIEIEPRYADTWKRRGQARSALGESEAALADLAKAIELLPLWGQDTSASQAECYVEKGLIYQKQRDYQRATQALKQAVKLDANNHQAWNLLGLSSTSQGDLRDGVRAYEKAVALKPDFKEAWFNMAQARKEAGLITEAEAAFARLQALEGPGKVNVAALKVQSQMQQQAGQHWAAIQLLDKALVAAKDDVMKLDLHFLRAICYHALGLVREAVHDYEACLSGPLATPPNLATGGTAVPEETRSQQYLAFYQREMALYLHHSLDRRADSFCPDVELGALFKEMWCKKGAPTPELLSSYLPQAALPGSPAVPAPALAPAERQALQQLVAVADAIGAQLQNQHQGFMSNVRQQRAAGFAALELAQAVRALVAARREGSTLWVSHSAASGGASSSSGGCSSSSVAVQGAGSAGGAGAGGGRHAFGWRDAMDIVVKWRQLAEPNDQVLWVDLLTRREFEQGFGSHTPIFSGQTKCVRYYMNFERALALHKQVLLQEGHAFDAQNRHVPCGGQHQQDGIRSARTCADMYAVLKSDSWVVIPIASLSRPSHTLEGTRLTLVKVPNQPDAFEFSIRTPVTPPRWRDFDAELQAAWENVVAVLAAEPLEPARAATAIMAYAYYWYNFMPLARGTAACGYTTMLSLFWAAGMPITARIPKGVQVDWEAILAQHPDQFMAAISPWMLPPQARQQGGDKSAAAAPAPAGSAAPPDVADLPTVRAHLGTVRQRLQALNPPEVPRL